jgi:uncharacterized protein YdcH (DUF465 family)
MKVVLYDPPSPFNPYNQILQTRRGPHAYPDVRNHGKGEVSLMEHKPEDLKAHLMETSDEFRSLAQQHAQLKQQLEAIEAKPHLTIADEDQEHQIKKQKLRLKDQMNNIMARYKAQVA